MESQQQPVEHPQESEREDLMRRRKARSAGILLRDRFVHRTIRKQGVEFHLRENPGLVDVMTRYKEYFQS